LQTGRPTIALIEDDPLVRMALARAIDDASYNVVSAASGLEGVALLSDRRQPIDLVVIDIVLPGRLDGVALVREAKRHNPNLRVIFTSGHPPPDDVDLTQWGEFLPKPSRVAALLEMIARQLGKS
jgi:DNA-binding NtrC family response regulator